MGEGCSVALCTHLEFTMREQVTFLTSHRHRRRHNLAKRVPKRSRRGFKKVSLEDVGGEIATSSGSSWTNYKIV